MRVCCPSCTSAVDLDDRAAGVLIRCRNCGRSFVAPEELATIGQPHTLSAFSVPGLVLLHFVTVGVFPVIHLGLMHDRLPKIRRSDPSGFVATALSFIPVVNAIWFFFTFRRLCVRVNEQRRLAGLPETAPQTMAIVVAALLACGSAGTILALAGWVVLGATLSVLVPVFLAMLQASVNQLVAATASRAAEPALSIYGEVEAATGPGPGDRDLGSARQRGPLAGTTAAGGRRP